MIRLVAILFFITPAACSYKDYLNQYLHEFQELSKHHVYIEHVTNFTVITAMRVYVRIDLQDRVFHASLKPHVDLFHPDLVVKNSEGKSSINIHEYLEGSLLDDPGSRVLVHIKDGIVTGSIQTSDREKMFIEPSHRHVKEPHDFHMIAYKLSHVKFNFSKTEEADGHFCGHESHDGETEFSEEDFDFMLPKNDVPLEDGFEYTRKKRATEAKNRCPLALVADYKFYNEVNDGEEANAINYMIGLIQQIDPLYRRQSLDPDLSEAYKEYGFSIKHIEVVTDPDEEDDETSYKYYKDASYLRGVSDLLKNFAYGDWTTKYCLAHLFTSYDFSGGVLGLAYVASPSSSRVGGVCTRTYRDSTGRTKHLNVGLTTVQNYGRTLLTSEVVFVTGHEFGHNWGSSHDSDTYAACAPSNNRFMMYPAAVDGSQRNNEYFSPCSVQAIHDVLVAKSDDCFTPSSAAICGNGYVESGEECDPGMKDSSCCVDCKLTSSAQCEPVNDNCCGDNCRFASGRTCLDTKWATADSKYCQKDHTCQLNTDNNKYECTAGDDAPDATDCYDNGSCKDGECLDLCTYNNKFPCLCDTTDICKQCCRDTADGECKIFGAGDNLPDGKICGNGNCVSGTCEVGPQDIQEKFWDVIDRINVNSVLLWFRNNVVFAVILFTSIFWIPISLFVNWLDDKYDLGVMDDFLGSSNAERKPNPATGSTMLLQERKSLESKPSNNQTSPAFLYPKLDTKL